MRSETEDFIEGSSIEVERRARTEICVQTRISMVEQRGVVRTRLDSYGPGERWVTRSGRREDD